MEIYIYKHEMSPFTTLSLGCYSIKIHFISSAVFIIYPNFLNAKLLKLYSIIVILHSVVYI